MKKKSAAEDDLVPEMFVLFLKSAIIIIRNNLFFIFFFHLFVNFPNHPFELTRVLHVVNCSIAIPRSKPACMYTCMLWPNQIITLILYYIIKKKIGKTNY